MEIKSDKRAGTLTCQECHEHVSEVNVRTYKCKECHERGKKQQ